MSTTLGGRGMFIMNIFSLPVVPGLFRFFICPLHTTIYKFKKRFDITPRIRYIHSNYLRGTRDQFYSFDITFCRERYRHRQPWQLK